MMKCGSRKLRCVGSILNIKVTAKTPESAGSIKSNSTAAITTTSSATTTTTSATSTTSSIKDKEDKVK